VSLAGGEATVGELSPVRGRPGLVNAGTGPADTGARLSVRGGEREAGEKGFYFFFVFQKIIKCVVHCKNHN
jgi:hypothetical protein